LALHLQRGSYDPSLPVSAWALAIARHKLVDLWRRRGRRDNLHEAIDEVDEGLLAADPDDGGAACDLGQLLRRLPAAQRQAIVLTKVEGLSVAEAAARTGASESAIKVQVHRGLKRLAALVRANNFA
jgi:RNA polymerase sigma-70 factor (ECF subfamily)